MQDPLRQILTAALLVPALLSASCSGIPPRERRATELRRYEAYAGQPVPTLVSSSGYRRWTPRSADTLLVWTDLDRPYLVQVFHPCADLLFARRIGITSTLDSVQARRNFVTAEGWRCMIRTIRPVTDPRLQHTQPARRMAPPADAPGSE